MATVQLFASFAEHFGAPSVEVPIADGSTVQDLVERIRSLSGLVIPPSARIAVNHEFASDHTVIAATDEIALIPPVAGG